jgi:hypothetical protein
MNKQRLNRPSLKITRRIDQAQVDSFTFEVWSPFVGSYQPMDSMEDGLRRVDELAGLICKMWLQRHPKQELLADVPEAGGSDGGQWAEFRVNATTYRSYDTRRNDRPGWVRVAGMLQATETTCARVGYALPALIAS